MVLTRGGGAVGGGGGGLSSFRSLLRVELFPPPPDPLQAALFTRNSYGVFILYFGL